LPSERHFITIPDGSQTTDKTTAADDAALVRDFSLKALPDAFYDDPYPTYRALRNHDPFIGCPMDRCS
jgi:hypothetical protein